MSDYSIKELGQIIEAAVECLKNDHSFLLKEKNNLNERTVTSQLRAILSKFFPDFDVDAEYNRMDVNGQYRPKAIDHLEAGVFDETVPYDDLEGRTVFPDIIVHRRGTNENLLVIEVKMAWKSGKAGLDEEKLSAYTDREKGLGYRFGLYLEIGEKGIEKTKWFVNGRGN